MSELHDQVKRGLHWKMQRGYVFWCETPECGASIVSDNEKELMEGALKSGWDWHGGKVLCPAHRVNGVGDLPSQTSTHTKAAVRILYNMIAELYRRDGFTDMGGLEADLSSVVWHILKACKTDAPLS